MNITIEIAVRELRSARAAPRFQGGVDADARLFPLNRPSA